MNTAADTSTLMTGADYRESLRRLRPTVFVDGRRVESVADDPALQPGINAVALTYDLAHRPELARLMTPVEQSSGRVVNRMTHLSTSSGDLLNKLEAVRLIWLNANDDARGWFYANFPLGMDQLAMVMLMPAAICAFLIRDRALVFTAILLMITLSAQWIARGYDWSLSERSFFGVMRVANSPDPRLGGDVHVLMHGTTLHGAQARDSCTLTADPATRAVLYQDGDCETRVTPMFSEMMARPMCRPLLLP